MRQKEKEVGEALLQKYLADCQQRGVPVCDEMRDSLREKATKEHVTMKDCLHSVRIGFQAFLSDPQKAQMIVTPLLLSEPIYNSRTFWREI